MECFVEQGDDYQDCMSRILSKYGDRVVPLRQRKVRLGGFLGLFTREGIEIEFYIPSYYAGGFPQSPYRLQETRFPGKPQEPKSLDFEERKEKVIAAAGRDPAMQTILREIRSIKESIEAENGPAREEEHPAFAKIRELLERNDFSASYTGKIIDRMRKECPLEVLDDFDVLEEKVLEWIGEGVRIFQSPDMSRTRPRILILVGPTGVGKTTTIAKLAAAYSVKGWYGRPVQVGMITIDGYRIAARDQIEKYGNIMGIPVAYATNTEEIRKAVALYGAEAGLILVDTIGKSPRDAVKIGEMKGLLEVCGSDAETHLAVAATTKYSDLMDIMRQFAPFNYRAVAVTKLDETVRIGNVLSALWDQGKEVSFITDGQSVDKHLHRASTVRFLINLEGFKVNRNKIETRFGNGVANGRSS
jgi:flagellar biosynthesis protein FlhF